jgi:hypothetical protein
MIIIKVIPNKYLQMKAMNELDIICGTRGLHRHFSSCQKWWGLRQVDILDRDSEFRTNDGKVGKKEKGKYRVCNNWEIKIV